MQATKIPWTDLSWNPVTGCQNTCPYCYARALSRRFGRSFEPAFHPDRLAQPGRQKKAKKIFVCSMADLMGAWVPAKWIKAEEVRRTKGNLNFEFKGRLTLEAGKNYQGEYEIK